MMQKAISDQIKRGVKIVYRRVSTKNQRENGYRDQLRTIKAHDTNLTLASEHVIDLKENISGFATSEQRVAGALGKGLRLLQRNPFATMIVADADRISRTTDVFELILAQGLGHRVKDLSSGLTVAEIVSTGQHHEIAWASKAQKKSQTRRTDQVSCKRRRLGQGRDQKSRCLRCCEPKAEDAGHHRRHTGMFTRPCDPQERCRTIFQGNCPAGPVARHKNRSRSFLHPGSAKAVQEAQSESMVQSP